MSANRDATGRFYGSVSGADSATIEIAVYSWFSGAAAADANAQWLGDTGDPATFTTTPYETWLGPRPGREFKPGLWVNIDADTMTGLNEQYVP